MPIYIDLPRIKILLETIFTQSTALKSSNSNVIDVDEKHALSNFWHYQEKGWESDPCQDNYENFQAGGIISSQCVI